MSLLENEDFCRAVESIQKKFSTPGISVSVVDLASGTKQSKGFVLPGTGTVINDDTVLPVASNTKLFTVFALAILVDENRIPSFDVKLRDIIPDLDLVDKYATETLTLAEMLSHQGGLAG
jgi:CubicO group peptidase (beta-lactamase class C family)